MEGAGILDAEDFALGLVHGDSRVSPFPLLEGFEEEEILALSLLVPFDLFRGVDADTVGDIAGTETAAAARQN